MSEAFSAALFSLLFREDDGKAADASVPSFLVFQCYSRRYTHSDKRRKKRNASEHPASTQKPGCHDETLRSSRAWLGKEKRREKKCGTKHGAGSSLVHFLPYAVCFLQRIYFQNHAERARVSPSVADSFYESKNARLPINNFRLAAALSLPTVVLLVFLHLKESSGYMCCICSLNSRFTLHFKIIFR